MLMLMLMLLLLLMLIIVIVIESMSAFKETAATGPIDLSRLL